MLWVAGRLSCTTALLAERRSFNLFSAMAESWRLTLEDEWRIMRYLALVGLVLSFLMILIGGAAIAVLTLALGESLNGNGLARQALATLFGLPLAYFMVLIPAGIYRELAGSPMADAEVFA